MSETKQYAYVIVYSTNHAIQIEKIFNQRGIPCKLVPVPRHLSSDCGVCISILKQDISLAHETIASCGVEVEGIY